MNDSPTSEIPPRRTNRAWRGLRNRLFWTIGLLVLTLSGWVSYDQMRVRSFLRMMEDVTGRKAMDPAPISPGSDSPCVVWRSPATEWVLVNRPIPSKLLNNVLAGAFESYIQPDQIYLGSQEVPEFVWAEIASFQSIRQLYLQSPALTDRHLRILSKLPNVDRLFLSSPRITDHSIPSLSRFSKLEVLSLTRTKITSEGAASLQRPGLELGYNPAT